MDKTVKEILDIFGEYEKAVLDIVERINNGVLSGSMEWVFYREDYDEITKEMQEIFGEDDVASITIVWDLDIY